MLPEPSAAAFRTDGLCHNRHARTLDTLFAGVGVRSHAVIKPHQMAFVFVADHASLQCKPCVVLQRFCVLRRTSRNKGVVPERHPHHHIEKLSWQLLMMTSSMGCPKSCPHAHGAWVLRGVAGDQASRAHHGAFNSLHALAWIRTIKPQPGFTPQAAARRA